MCIMKHIFSGVHTLKQSVPRQYNVRKTQSFDPIPPVAKEISNEAWLLCFDEFQVFIYSMIEMENLLFTLYYCKD